MSCGVGRRCGLDLALLWLWCRPAATAQIGPLAWEPPYATGVALEKAKRHTQKKFNSKGIKGPYIRTKTIKPSEEKIGVKIHDLGLGNSFLIVQQNTRGEK